MYELYQNDKLFLDRLRQEVLLAKERAMEEEREREAEEEKIREEEEEREEKERKEEKRRQRDEQDKNEETRKTEMSEKTHASSQTKAEDNDGSEEEFLEKQRSRFASRSFSTSLLPSTPGPSPPISQEASGGKSFLKMGALSSFTSR